MKLSEIVAELKELKGKLSDLLTGKATAEQSTNFQTRLTAIELAVTTELTAKDVTIGERDQSIKDLRAEIESNKGQMDQLTRDLAAEKKKTSDTLAAQGLPADQLPAAEAKGTAEGTAETAWQKYARLADKDPVAAGQFYMDNAAAVLGSRYKKS